MYKPDVRVEKPGTIKFEFGGRTAELSRGIIEELQKHQGKIAITTDVGNPAADKARMKEVLHGERVEVNDTGEKWNFSITDENSGMQFFAVKFVFDTEELAQAAAQELYSKAIKYQL